MGRIKYKVSPNTFFPIVSPSFFHLLIEKLFLLLKALVLKALAN